jgi:hypothetical protein
VLVIAIDDLLPEAITIGQHVEGLNFFVAEHGRPGCGMPDTLSPQQNESFATRTYAHLIPSVTIDRRKPRE